MIHKEVYKQFEFYLPLFAQNVEVWFPNGKNSIRVRQTDKREFIFTYDGQRRWIFETVENFLNRMKGERKM